MIKHLFIILLSVLSITAFGQQKKVAVYVIGDDTGVNKVLGTKLVSAIARSEEYTAVERTSEFLAKLSKEQKYQRTGAVDDNDISRLGKQFGVQLVCVASITEAFGGQYVSARLIDVETAQVERSTGSDTSIQSLNDLIEVSEKISYKLLSTNTERDQQAKKVAVYVTKNDAGKGIGIVLGNQLVAGFTNSGRYVAIERTNSFLSQLGKEQNYQRTGAVNDNDISRLGKQFGVQYVCVADVSDVFGEKFISARLIDVETAEVVNTHEVGGQVSKMSDCVEMANDIASNLSKGTLAEQAEEARIREAEEEQIRAEMARKKAEIEAKRKAEEEARIREAEEKERALQARIAKRKEELTSMFNKGYLIFKDDDGVKWMLCLEPIEISNNDLKKIKKETTYSRCGYYDWKIARWFYGREEKDEDADADADVNPYNYIRISVLEEQELDYINGISDDVTYNLNYILMEYMHYFNKDIRDQLSGEFWQSTGHSVYFSLYWSQTDNPHTYFLDGVNDIWLDCSSDLNFSSNYIEEHGKKAWGKKIAKAYLVRRM